MSNCPRTHLKHWTGAPVSLVEPSLAGPCVDASGLCADEVCSPAGPSCDAYGDSALGALARAMAADWPSLIRYHRSMIIQGFPHGDPARRVAGSPIERPGSGEE